jgi:hypothetical protein
MKQSRLRELALKDAGGGRWVARPGVKVEKTVSSSAGHYRTASVRIVDTVRGRTTYHVFVFVLTTTHYAHLELQCSAEVHDYPYYRGLLERRVAPTLRIDASKIDQGKPGAK